MIDDQASCLKTISEQDESLLFLGMVRVIEQTGAFVEKCSLRLLEGNAVLCQVGSRLAIVPGKFDIAHGIILAISILSRAAAGPCEILTAWFLRHF